MTDASNASRTLLFDIHARDMGRRASRSSSTSRGRSFPASCPPRSSVATTVLGRRVRAHRGHRGRSAGGPLRSGLRPAGGSRRTRTAPAASSSSTRAATRRRLEEPPDHDRRLGSRRRVHRTPSRAASSSRGAAVQWLRDGLEAHPDGRGHRGARRGRDGQRRRLSSFPRSRGSARRTGTRTRAARSSGSPAARPPAIWRARSSSRSPSRARDVLVAMEKDAGLTLTELRVDGGAAANDLLMQFQADLLGVPVVQTRGPRDDRPRRGLSRRPRRGHLEGRRRDPRELESRPALRARDVARPGGQASAPAGRRPSAARRAGPERHSTVTDFARLRGWSMSQPRRRATWYARSWRGTTDTIG